MATKQELEAQLREIEAAEQQTAQAAEQKWTDAKTRLESVVGHTLDLGNSAYKLIVYLDILLHNGGLDQEQ